MARALWLADVLRAAGLTVVEDGGWRDRGRSDFTPVGVVCHATAGSQQQSNDSAWNVLVNGREGLAGPISQVMLERGTLRWRMVCSGASNHAKVGWAGPCRGLGNRDLIGIEAHHDNLREPWSEAALDVYARGVAAICRHLRTGVDRVALHREHQPGEKTDPTFDGPAFRARVHRHLTGATTSGRADDMGTFIASDGKDYYAVSGFRSTRIRPGTLNSVVQVLTQFGQLLPRAVAPFPGEWSVVQTPAGPVDVRLGWGPDVFGPVDPPPTDPAALAAALAAVPGFADQVGAAIAARLTPIAGQAPDPLSADDLAEALDAAVDHLRGQ